MNEDILRLAKECGIDRGHLYQLIELQIRPDAPDVPTDILIKLAAHIREKDLARIAELEEALKDLLEWHDASPELRNKGVVGAVNVLSSPPTKSNFLAEYRKKVLEEAGDEIADLYGHTDEIEEVRADLMQIANKGDE